jgi:arsenite methyltransferase
MTQQSAEEIRAAVEAAYGARACEVLEGRDSSCCDTACCSDGAAGVIDEFYQSTETAGLPDSVVSYGCGNPTALADLKPGDTVLDLGSGAGLDCFLSAGKVGPTGRVIGLDMTDDMLILAEQNKAKLGITNVEFRKGVMEAIPVEDASVDMIISNCVINLSPDKDAVFVEAFRVLRPGGRLHVSDVVLLKQLSDEEQTDLAMWAGCVSGALERDDYQTRLQATGFADIRVELEHPSAGSTSSGAWASALITARRPGGPDTGKPWLSATADRLEIVTPSALEQAPCCGPGATDPSRCC